MPGEIHSALVPVEQPDLTAVGDPDVGGRRVSVDQRHRHVGDRSEHVEHDFGNVVRERGHVGVDTARRRAEFGDGHAPGALLDVVTCGVQPLEFGGDESPVVLRRWRRTLQPLLHHNAAVRPGAVGRRDRPRHAESSAGEFQREIEFPGERFGSSTRPSHRNSLSVERAGPHFVAVRLVASVMDEQTGPRADLLHDSTLDRAPGWRSDAPHWCARRSVLHGLFRSDGVTRNVDETLIECQSRQVATARNNASPNITGMRTTKEFGARCATCAGSRRCGDRRSTTPLSPWSTCSRVNGGSTSARAWALARSAPQRPAPT